MKYDAWSHNPIMLLFIIAIFQKLTEELWAMKAMEHAEVYYNVRNLNE